MWPKYLPLATFAYNTFNTPNLLLNLETMPDIKVSSTFKDYYELVNKRLQYLHKLLHNFKAKRLAMINKDRMFFQYNSRDLVYIISPLTCQLCTTSRKVMIKYIGPVVIYKIVGPHNYLLMTLDGKILRGLFKHERLMLPLVTYTKILPIVLPTCRPTSEPTYCPAVGQHVS